MISPTMSIQLDVFRHENRSIELAKFLSREDIGCLGTTDGADPFIAIVFYVYDNGRLFFKSRTISGHATHLVDHATASFAIFLKSSTPDAKYGAQLIGRAACVRDTQTMKSVVELHCGRFARPIGKLPSIQELCSDKIASTFYQFDILKFKIIDEDKVRNRTMLQYEDYH